MGNTMILLGEIGEWIFYKYYFDKENNCFIEEKYHHEYLDTGTVLDDSNIVSAQQVYIAFVEDMNTDGINALLKCCNNIELPDTFENEITEQEFYKKLEELDQFLRRKIQKIDSTYILKNQQDEIIGVLSKTEHFFAYVDLYKKGKGFISKNEAFTYIIECLSERYRPTNSITVLHTAQTEQPNQKKSQKTNTLKSIFKKK